MVGQITQWYVIAVSVINTKHQVKLVELTTGN